MSVHSYSIFGTPRIGRGRIHSVLAVAAVVLASLAAGMLPNGTPSLLQQAGILEIRRYLTLTTTWAFFGLLVSAFDKWSWRTRLGRMIFLRAEMIRPYLGGVYTGKLSCSSRESSG